jgi:hypothetical protein
LTNGGHISAEELTLLAVGAMPEEHCAALRAHAAECVDCGAKLAEARGQAALLAWGVALEKPAATIKAELFARIRAEREQEEMYRWPAKSGEEAAHAPARKSRRGWSLVPVAAALAIATTWEWKENQRMAGELASANHQIVKMTNERQRAEMLVDLLSSPDTVSVRLAAAPETQPSAGMVRYNAKRGMVVYTAELPALPADKIYQMWLVPATGAPISAGIFAPGPHGTRQLWTAEVPMNTEVKAFAVTIEPAGGVAQPTGPKVLVGAG